MAEELLDGTLSTRVTSDEKAALLANAEKLGSSKDIVLRELIRAFNALCAEGKRPTFPLAVSSPAYRVEGGRVVDANAPALAELTDEEFVAEMKKAAAVIKARRAESPKPATTKRAR